MKLARKVPAMAAISPAITQEPVKTRLTLIPIKNAAVVSSAVARSVMPELENLKNKKKTTSRMAVQIMV